MKKRHYAITGGVIALLSLAYLLGIAGRTEDKAGAPVQVKPVRRESVGDRESADERAKREHAEWVKATIKLAQTSPAASHELWLDMERNAEPNPLMNPAYAAARLEQARGIANMMQRGMACRKIIQELCQAGYVGEAWELIDKDHGKVRSLELDAFFGSKMVDLATFEARFKELGDKDEVWHAMNARMLTYKIGDLVKALMSQQVDRQYLALKDLDPDAFSNSVFNRLHSTLPDIPVPEREARLSDAIALQQKGLLRPEEPVRLLGIMGDYDVFKKWRTFSDYTGRTDFGDKSGFVDITREQFIGQMFRESPSQSIDLILKSEGTAGARDLKVAVQQWSELDSRGAAEWYEKNASTLSPEKQSSAASGFFGLALNNGELDVARQWANQITEPRAREEALAAIEKKETGQGK
jgi:hypothetical protein